MKKFSKKLVNYIEISNFERGGLMVLLFSLLVVPGYYCWKNSHPAKYTTVDEEKLAAFRAQVDSAFQSVKFNRKEYAPKKHRLYKDHPLKPFNPNSDSQAQLQEKGVPHFVARNIINFRNAGGRFRYKEDVAKIYAVNNDMYSKLSPYINLPYKTEYVNQERSYDTSGIKKEFIRPVNLNINLLTTEELRELPGIGEFYATQIVIYRDKLGGYLNKEQILEVYKMREESAAAISDMFVYAQDITKIKVNSATFKGLLAHPYLNYKQVKSVMNYREQHGQFSSLEEFENLHIFKGKDIGRLLPYLDLN